MRLRPRKASRMFVDSAFRSLHPARKFRARFGVHSTIESARLISPVHAAAGTACIMSADLGSRNLSVEGYNDNLCSHGKSNPVRTSPGRTHVAAGNGNCL